MLSIVIGGSCKHLFQSQIIINQISKHCRKHNVIPVMLSDLVMVKVVPQEYYFATELAFVAMG